MKTQLTGKLSLWLALNTLIPLAPAALADIDPPGTPLDSVASLTAPADPRGGQKRLIQTGTRTTRWMDSREIDALIEKNHRKGVCGGFFDVTEHRDARDWPVRHAVRLDDRKPTQQQVVNKILPLVSPKSLEELVRKLSSFPDRLSTSDNGVKAVHWIRDQYAKAAGRRQDVKVELFNHKFKQPSVIARIEGKGQRAAERVILGGHADSINMSGGAAPGADDDASGSGTLLEAFRVLMQAGYKPDRTIEFMAYAGEERGLLGSQDIAESYRKQGIKVAAVLQLDMTLYPAKSRAISMITDNVDPGLTKFMGALVDEYLKVTRTETRCGYACSDHASWHRAGYPAVFPFESPFRELNPNIHTTRDKLENGLDIEYGVNFVKLAVAYAVEMAAMR